MNAPDPKPAKLKFPKPEVARLHSHHKWNLCGKCGLRLRECLCAVPLVHERVNKWGYEGVFTL